MFKDHPYSDFISRYFLDPDKRVYLKKGEVLIHQNEENSKLYLVLEGKLQGFLPDSMIENFPAFEAEPGKFVGVYSYFSAVGKSYSQVQASEDSIVAYHDIPLTEHSRDELVEIMPAVLSIIVNELSTRQHFASLMAKESQNHLQKLMKTEKMVTLGQMAAGLAHELNNSIGSISSNIVQLEDYLAKCLKKYSGKLLSFFLIGLEKGQYLSSSDARDNRNAYTKKLNAGSNLVRKLAKTGLDVDQLRKVAGKSETQLEEIYEAWEAGATIHDLRISAKQSTHVVQSVKQLGVAEHSWSQNVHIDSTISESLAILKSLTKKVTLQVDLNSESRIEAIPGELVQIWINIIKNAIESMLHSKTKTPTLKVISTEDSKFVKVEIWDNGPGVPDKIKSKIFEPSFTTKKGGLSFGLGLGLTIVQRIIEGHNGKIELDSQPGSTMFKIRIPKK